MGYPKIVEDAKCVMYFNFYENMPYGLFHATFVIIERPSRLAPSSTSGTLFIYFFLTTRTTKQDDAAVFSATSPTELEQNYSSGLVENNTSLFAEIPKYFYFV